MNSDKQPHPVQRPRAIVVMGVSGSGKSTVAEQLAAKLRLPYFDADDFHPAQNIAKMSAGTPLDDADRVPWLDRLHQLIEEHLNGNGLILACSALKVAYRDRLRGSLQQVEFVYLNGTFDQILQRMQQRSGHFMKADMLRSQFDALEPPSTVEAICLSIDQPPEAIINMLLHRLATPQNSAS